VRPRGGPRPALDWEEIERLARRRLGGEERLGPARTRRLEALYARLAAEVRPVFLEVVGGLPGGASLPSFQALDRVGWLDVNTRIMRRAIDPLLAANPVPNSLLTELGRAGMDRYVAVILAFLSRRVLGQFDPQLFGKEPVEPSGLYLVEPNIAAWEAEAKVPGEELRRWLILHEMTHAWQFAAHPWLRDHLNASLEGVLALGRERGLLARGLALTVGLPRQMGALRQMQATMSLVEGYSNLVMNLAGRRVLPAFDELERAYRQRTRERSLLETLFLKLTGLDLKMQQYERGEAFSRLVHERHGMAVLNQAWERAENLPRPEELGDSERWYGRVIAPSTPGRRAPRPAPAH
jgi:coenzyme F420 biosynthesis associated uncharacterized protein